MKKIGIFAVSTITLCWAMYEVSSDNTNTVTHSESSQKVASKKFSSTAKDEKLTSQTLFAKTNSLNSAPVCQYNFDVTQEDLDLWNNEHPDFPIKIFPLIIGQKFGFKVEPTPESQYGYVDYVATSKVDSLNSVNEIGDLTIPHTGIIAFEMELKIPTSTLGSSSLGNSTYYSSSIGFSGVTNNGYTIRSNYWFDMGGMIQILARILLD